MVNCIFLLLIACYSCNYLPFNRPSNIKPIDSVAVIIADSYFVEGEIYATRNIHNNEEYAVAKYNLLFEKHGITKETYYQNIRYYITHKTHWEILMKKVDEIVEQRVAALRDSLEVEKHVIAFRDSLNSEINLEN